MLEKIGWIWKKMDLRICGSRLVSSKMGLAILPAALPDSTRSDNNDKVSFDEATAGLESSTHVNLGVPCLATPSSKGIPESNVVWKEVRDVRTGKVLHSEPFAADQSPSGLPGPTDLKTTFWFRSGSVSDSGEQSHPQKVFPAEPGRTCCAVCDISLRCSL